MSRRRPYYVEVLGTPEAGKTTVIKRLATYFEEQGYHVKYIQETAEITPSIYPKGSVEAHFWMNFNLMQSLTFPPKDNTDLVIIDRGIFDALLWNSLFFKNGKMSLQQLSIFQTFLFEFFPLPNLTIFLVANAEEVIRRKGSEGRIVTSAFVKDYNASLLLFAESISKPKLVMDTSNLTPDFVFQALKHSINRALLKYNRRK